MMESETKLRQQPLLERVDIGGLTDGPTWQLLSLAAEHYQPNSLTDIMVGYVANFQRRDGSWWNGGVARSPLEEGAIARTAIAIRALQS